MFRTLSAIAVFMLFLGIGSARAEDVASVFVPLSTPEALPAFVFEDAEGKSLRLDDFRGKAVVLNIWASWCPPCVAEMPSLDALQKNFPDRKLVVIALNADRGGTVATVNFFRRHEIHNLSVYNDPTGRVSSVLHARNLPTSFLIAPDGKEIGMVEGDADWSSAESIAFLREKLMKP